MAHEIILISISGEDRPGVASSITEILGRYNSIILDIGQANLHHQLSLGIMIRNDSPDKTGDMLKEILFRTSELGVFVRFTPITDEAYNAWVGRQGKSRYVVTLLGHVLTAKQISLVTDELSSRGLNIDSIKRLTGRPSLDWTEEKIY